jgi:carbon dioxide concentrating mechanism protein CcmM
MVAHSTIHSVAQHAATAVPSSGRPTYSNTNPNVHSLADVHEFSLLEGDVTISAKAVIAPGTAVTAESGASVAIGEQCALLPGVIVEGVAGAQVAGAQDRNLRYSVWVGDRTIIAHKSIIHSPAFISEDCFIGFRSTIFNARLGKGCVVMMHALVQDVEIPPGKCVPSGSIITSQHQADQLPQVRPEDLEYAREIIGTSVGAALGSVSNLKRQEAPRSKPRLVPINSPAPPSSSTHSCANFSPHASPRSAPPYSHRQSSQATEGANMQATQTQRLSPEIVQQVRQHLSQGYRIGMEHADLRRYRSGVWETCTPIKDTREQAVFEGLERCMAEHAGEYVRMFGIDTHAKRRVGMVTVQRPGDAPASNAGSAGSANFGSRPSPAYGANGSGGNGANGRSAGGLSPEVVQEVRNLLRSGHIIGTEHADTRHYRSNVWKSCSPISSSNDQEVFSRLEHCLNEHSDEFVRMFGIDPKAKRRTAYTTIQRADGKPVSVSFSRPVAAGDAGNHQSAPQGGYSAGGGQSSEVSQVVSQILRQGGKIGVEIADVRRYRSGIWQTAPSLQSVSQLQNFLSQNTDKYVRIFSVNASMKTRGATTTVQKPGQSGAEQVAGSQSNVYSSAGRDPINANPPHYDDPAYLNKGSGYGNSGGNGALDSTVMDQVTQLVNQGCRISIEFADKRRFRSGIWQTGPAIEARRPAEAIAALNKQLAQHAGDYVRLVGTDPQAKRRVVETTIQRP